MSQKINNTVIKEFHGKYGTVVLMMDDGLNKIRTERTNADGSPSVRVFGNLNLNGANVLYDMLVYSVCSRLPSQFPPKQSTR